MDGEGWSAPGAGWIRRDDPRWGPPPEEDWSADPDEDLGARFVALGRFTRLAAPYVTLAEAPDLAAAAELAQRAGARLSMGGLGARRLGGHTVVALAGATGAGKSSVFNALAGMPLSPAGHLRPTTGEAYACVWDARGADVLLDWLGVAPARRFMRESPLDAEDEATLRGLVLLDLPDMDSIAAANRIEADRLVGLVDRVVWVLDPQKYADAIVHEDYLRQMGALREVTVVVFNQTDRLAPADADRCRADLARLIEADGLPGVPVIGASTVTGEGVEQVRGLLETVVADRHAAMVRLAAELGVTAANLTLLAPVAAPDEQDVSRHVADLGRAFADACGTEALVADAAAAYRERAVLWRAPWRRDAAYPPVPPADPAAVAAGVRRLAEQVSRGLPEPWPRHLRAAARAEVDHIPDRLARVLSAARGRSPVPPLWRVLRVAPWLTAAVAASSLAAAVTTMAALPWLGWAAAALGVGLVLPTVAIGTGAWRTRRYRRAVARRLHLAALEVAREVVAPVRRILRDYGEAHTVLQAARPPDSVDRPAPARGVANPAGSRPRDRGHG